MYIERTCPFCKQLKGIDIDVEQWQIDDWEYGKMIQHAMPNLTADEREHILTGICPDCWPSENSEWEN